jgi:hypothetical protein
MRSESGETSLTGGCLNRYRSSSPPQLTGPGPSMGAGVKPEKKRWSLRSVHCGGASAQDDGENPPWAAPSQRSRPGPDEGRSLQQLHSQAREAARAEQTDPCWVLESKAAQGGRVRSRPWWGPKGGWDTGLSPAATCRMSCHRERMEFQVLESGVCTHVGLVFRFFFVTSRFRLLSTSFLSAVRSLVHL